MELKTHFNTKKSEKSFSCINRRTVDRIQEELLNTILIAIYYNDVGKVLRIHV
jgi:hypothetical protein